MWSVARTMSVRTEKISIEQVGEVLRAMADEGKVDELLETVLRLLTKLHSENQSLQLRVMKLLRERYGRRSEKVDAAQLSLLLGELSEEAAQSLEDDRKSEQAASEQAARPRKKDKPGHGWTKLPKDLPVEDVQVPLAEEDKRCGCGSERHVIGHAITLELDFNPGSFFMRRYLREKGACRACEEGIVTAPAPDKVIEDGRPGPGLLAHILTSKYMDHCPLTRLRRIYLRSGVNISVSTLSDWVKEAAELLNPIARGIIEQVLESHVLQTDATGLRVLDKDRKPKVAKGTVWAYVGDGDKVAFDYTPTGEGEHPRRFLEGRTGWLQADAASVFDALYADGTMVEVGCWAHARRKFHKLVERDSRAAKMVLLIGELYKLERDASEKGMSEEERLALRKDQAPPVLDKIKRLCVDISQRDPPKSDITKAAAYALNHWAALNRFLEDGRLKLDNNDCERALRTIAIGRKNYLFAGSHQAARRAATVYTVLSTCHLAGVDGQAYLTDVLKKIVSRSPVHKVEELLPAAWKARQASTGATDSA